MKIDLFSVQAQMSFNRSMEDVENRDYCLSWVRSIETRGLYLADLVIQAVLLPFYLIGALFGFAKSLYTSFHERVFLDKAIINASHAFHRVIFSAIGALISPYLANQIRNENLFTRSIQLLNFILPNRFSISAAGSLSFGYTVIKPK